MKKNNLIWIIICNILGALLLGSWLASTPTAGYHGHWLARKFDSCKSKKTLKAA